jgi:peptidoglycan-associated lipoprotein
VVERPRKSPAPPADTRRDIRPVETGSVDPLNDPKGVLANRSVYFDYDSYVVRDDGKPVVENHSAYLTKNKQPQDPDPGQHRRARRHRIQPGPGPEARRSRAQVDEHPGRAGTPDGSRLAGRRKAEGNRRNEAAWAENRRADIVYK